MQDTIRHNEVNILNSNDVESWSTIPVASNTPPLSEVGRFSLFKIREQQA